MQTAKSKNEPNKETKKYIYIFIYYAFRYLYVNQPEINNSTTTCHNNCNKATNKFLTERRHTRVSDGYRYAGGSEKGIRANL